MCAKKSDSKSEHIRCKEQLDDIIEILATHGRILEKHTDSIGDIGAVLKKIQSDIASINEHQKTQNQVVAGIHRLWSKLKCIAPEEGKNTKSDAKMDVDDFTRLTASNEIRQLGLSIVKPDDNSD